MHEEWLSRTELLLGQEKLNCLKEKKVLVVGLGGVGSFAAEMIVRAGIGKMTIVDGDTVNTTNINRQLPALHSNIGKSKAQLMQDRLMDINPCLELEVIDEFLRDERIEEVLNNHFDYVVDAIDTLSPKVNLIEKSLKRGFRIVSSMGAGAKIDPTKVHIAPLEKSFNCKLALKVRKKLGKLKADKNFPVVFSSEMAKMESIVPVEGEQNKKTIAGTISYMPAIFGMYCASVVIRDLTGDFEN
ncbi:MAG: tRNA threonylcarbamoyladenosine dehydratase [Bacteroidales bacterium]|nr:tRNA threonylcarbamoyladenosine dehydratase [Bacteroidales bacterium]